MTTSGRFFPTPTASDTRDGNVRRKADNLAQGGRHAVNLNHLIAYESTSSPEASPASPSPLPANERAQRMTAISGRNLRELFDVPDLVGAFLRMCRESSVWRTALTGYSLTWVRSATPQGRSLFRLRLSAPTTAVIGSGLWPTPREQTATGPSQTDTREGGADLQSAVMWPTLRHEGFDAGAHRGEPNSLHSAVKMLPTAATSDYKGSSQEGQRRGQLSEVVAGQKLSAAWVGRLMGYPDGWMDHLPSDPVGSPASPASRSTKPTA